MSQVKDQPCKIIKGGWWSKRGQKVSAFPHRHSLVPSVVPKIIRRAGRPKRVAPNDLTCTMAIFTRVALGNGGDYEGQTGLQRLATNPLHSSVIPSFPSPPRERSHALYRKLQRAFGGTSRWAWRRTIRHATSLKRRRDDGMQECLRRMSAGVQRCSPCGGGGGMLRRERDG